MQPFTKIPFSKSCSFISSFPCLPQRFIHWPIAQYLRYRYGVVLCRSVSSQSDLAILSENLGDTHNFPSQFAFHLYIFRCIECTCKLSCSSSPNQLSIIYTAAVSRAEYVKHLGVTIYINLGWPSYIFSCVERIPFPSFQICRMKQFGAKQTDVTSSIHQNVLPF